MAHYINDYIELWDHAGELEKKVAALQAQFGATNAAKSFAKAAKSSAEVEVNHLNQAISLEKK